MSLLNGREQFAIISYYDCGPVFGRARNLCVFPEKRKCGYSYLGDTYQCPPGHQNTFFTGSREFTVTDVEAWTLPLTNNRTVNNNNNNNNNLKKKKCTKENCGKMTIQRLLITIIKSIKKLIKK